MTTTHPDRFGHNSEGHTGADDAGADSVQESTSTSSSTSGRGGVGQPPGEWSENAALYQARQLWSAGQLVERLVAQRRAQMAAVGGALGAELDARTAAEVASAASVAEALRAEALRWVDEWCQQRRAQGIEVSRPVPPFFSRTSGGT